MLLFKTSLWFFFSLLISTINLNCQQDQIQNTLWTIAWSPNGNYIATGGDQGELKLFDAHTFELVQTFDVKDVILSRLKWNPFDNKLAVVTQSESFKTKVLDLDKNEWMDLSAMETSFRGLDWNHSGELLAVSGTEGEVYIFDKHGRQISRFQADPKGATGLDWHPYENILVTVGSQIGIFSQKGDTIHTFIPAKEERFLLCIEWHKSGDFFAVGDYGDLKKAENKLIQFWDIAGNKLNELKGSIGEYRNIRWSPDGEKFASASDALRIWSKEGSLLAETKSSGDYLWGVDWSPDGKSIVTSSSFGIISIWDDKAKLIKRIKY